MKLPGRLPVAARLLACAALFSLQLLPDRVVRADVGAWTSAGPADSIGAVAVAPSNNQIVYAIGGQGLWKSLDGGNSWSIVGSAKLDTAGALAIDPRNAAILYSGTSEPRGIVKSTDGGTTWSVLRPGVEPTAIAIDSTRPAIVYAGVVFGNTSQILKSVDSGATWNVATSLEVGFALPSFTGVAIQPDRPDTVFSTFQGYHGGAVRRSVDAGAHWTSLGGGVPLTLPTALAIGPRPGFGPVYVGWGLMGFKALFRSDDDGDTWQDLTSSLPSGGGNIASLVAPGSATTIIASFSGISGGTQEPGGVYVSLDGGESWDEPAASPENVGQLAWAPTTRTLYVGTSNGVWQYTLYATGFKKSVNPRFRDYYDGHDGFRILGGPISIGTVVGGNFAQYFGKGRIEDHTGESADPNWQLMYGLLVDELQQGGVSLPVGGETSTITYAMIRNQAAEGLRINPPPDFGGGAVPLPDGAVFVPFTTDLSPAPGHHVPGLFWEYMNRTDLFPAGWMHDIGLPITEPMDAVVDKGDETGRAITIQAFQRTILTYDPLNPPDWQVERANVGTDYQKAFPGRVPD